MDNGRCGSPLTEDAEAPGPDAISLEEVLAS
jgi:hypothetical protein